MSIGSKVSLRWPSSPSESTITGVWYCSARLNASTVTPKRSRTLRAASTGRSTSPCAEKIAWKRSDCSPLVGRPVDGPPRWTSTATSGSSAMVARPRISDLSDMPGPELTVMTFLPANDAPTHAPTLAISSSNCTTAPPYFQISRVMNCMTSVEGVMG